MLQKVFHSVISPHRVVYSLNLKTTTELHHQTCKFFNLHFKWILKVFFVKKGSGFWNLVSNLQWLFPLVGLHFSLCCLYTHACSTGEKESVPVRYKQLEWVQYLLIHTCPPRKPSASPAPVYIIFAVHDNFVSFIQRKKQGLAILQSAYWAWNFRRDMRVHKNKRSKANTILITWELIWKHHKLGKCDMSLDFREEKHCPSLPFI